MGSKVFILFLALCFNSNANKIDGFSIDTSKKHAIAFQVSPKTVNLQRWVPLDSQKGALHSVSPALVDLYDFPLMKTGLGTGVELSIGEKGQPEADGFLRVINIDNPAYPPFSSVDFNDVTLTKNDFQHSILKNFFDSVDKDWRYSVNGAILKNVNRGLLHIECPGACSLDIEGRYESFSLSKNGWLKFDFSLPKDSGWSVQVKAQVQLSNLGHRSTELWSPLTPVTNDSTSVLVDLFELFRGQHPLVKDAFLKKISVRFSKTTEKSKSVSETPILLGSMKVFPSMIEDSRPILFLPFQKVGESVDLLKFWESRMPPSVGRLVLTHRPVDLSLIGDNWRFVSSQSEKVPRAFVIDPVVADSLSSKELADVLDQNLFLEFNTLWSSGTSDIVLRNSGTSPFIIYSVNESKEPSTELFLRTFYRYEKGTQIPLRMTVFGLDNNSKKHSEHFLVHSGQHLQLKNFHLVSKITLAFEYPSVAPEEEPLSLQVEGISLYYVRKSKSFSPRNTSHAITQSFFSALPERVDTKISKGGEFHFIKKYQVHWVSSENLKIKYSISVPEHVNDRHFFKLLCTTENGADEKVFPIDTDGVLDVPRCRLQSLELLLSRRGPGALGQIRTEVRLLEISSIDSRLSTAPLELTNQKDRAVYSGIHFVASPSSANWVQNAFPLFPKPLDSPTININGRPLSLSEILNGGRKVELNETFLEAGMHGFKTVRGDQLEEVTVSKDFTHQLNEKATIGKTSVSSDRWPLAKILDKILSVIVLCMFVYFLCFFSRVMVFFDRFLIKSEYLNGVGFVLASLAFGVYFSSHPHRVTVAGLLLVSTYGLFVRYRIRSYLERNFNILKGRTKATPYLLAFLMMIVFCMINHFLGRKGTMELSAFIGYLLFIVAIVIDLSNAGRLFRSESESSN